MLGQIVHFRVCLRCQLEDCMLVILVGVGWGPKSGALADMTPLC